MLHKMIYPMLRYIESFPTNKLLNLKWLVVQNKIV